VTNRAYLLKDTATGMDGSGQTVITEAALFDATNTKWDGSLSGYYVTFATCEKGVNAPLLVAGYVYFGTNTAQPRTTQKCEETLGEANGYKLAPFTGAHTISEFQGGGLPPSPVAGIVNITDSNGVTHQYPFCIGCGNGEDSSSLDSSLPPITVLPNRKRTYWYTTGK
jgi:type IV pilus assembly protein PilY1